MKQLKSKDKLMLSATVYESFHGNIIQTNSLSFLV